MMNQREQSPDSNKPELVPSGSPSAYGRPAQPVWEGPNLQDLGTPANRWCTVVMTMVLGPKACFCLPYAGAGSVCCDSGAGGQSLKSYRSYPSATVAAWQCGCLSYQGRAMGPRWCFKLSKPLSGGPGQCGVWVTQAHRGAKFTVLRPKVRCCKRGSHYNAKITPAHTSLHPSPIHPTPTQPAVNPPYYAHYTALPRPLHRALVGQTPAWALVGQTPLQSLPRPLVGQTPIAQHCLGPTVGPL